MPYDDPGDLLESWKRGPHRLPDRRRRHAPARRDRLDAQPGADDHRQLPVQGPPRVVAGRGPALPGAPGRRRPRQQQPRLAVGRRHRHRRLAVLPGLQPRHPGPEVRPGRRLRAALGARARAPRRAGAPTSRGRPRTATTTATPSRSSTTPRSGPRPCEGTTRPVARLPGVQIWRSLDDVPADLGRTAVVIGNFDGVHLGHQHVVREARAVADAEGLRVVAVTFDPHPMAVLRPEHAPPPSPTSRPGPDCCTRPGSTTCWPCPSTARSRPGRPRSSRGACWPTPCRPRSSWWARTSATAPARRATSPP